MPKWATGLLRVTSFMKELVKAMYGDLEICIYTLGRKFPNDGPWTKRYICAWWASH